VPIVFRCRNCGHVIYVFRHVGQDYFGIPTPSELVNRVTMVCPRCGRVLTTRVRLEDVRVY